MEALRYWMDNPVSSGNIGAGSVELPPVLRNGTVSVAVPGQVLKAARIGRQRISLLQQADSPRHRHQE